MIPKGFSYVVGPHKFWKAEIKAASFSGQELMFVEGLVQKLKIYIYDIPDELSGKELYKTTQFHGSSIWDMCLQSCLSHYMQFMCVLDYGIEVHLIEYLLKHPSRTMNPEEADLFFIPFLSGCHFFSVGWAGLDLETERVNDTFTKLSNMYPRIKAIMNGENRVKDHLVIFPHDQGLPYPPDGFFNKFTHIVQFRNQDIDIIFPPHWGRPKTDKAPTLGRRKVFATFSGSCENGGVRMQFCEEMRKLIDLHPDLFDSTKILVDTNVNEFEQNLQESTFCLSPRGFSPTSTRLYAAMGLGCIPVIIAHKGLDFPLESFYKARNGCIVVSMEELPDLAEILQSFTEREIIRRQLILREVGYDTFITPDRGNSDAPFFDHLMMELARKAIQLGRLYVSDIGDDGKADFSY